MKFIDPDHPFFRPLWVRIAVVAACLGWALVEALTAQPFWAVLFGAVGVWVGWVLLVTNRNDNG